MNEEYNFKELFEKNQASYTTITIPNSLTEKITSFVNNIIKEKSKENHHIIDNVSQFKRFYTGTLGEVALEILLEKQFIDWSIGPSSYYNKADLKKIFLNVGIKTVEYGKFPIISKINNYPEIINIKLNDNQVVICGLATLNVLKDYRKNSLVLDDYLRARGTKTGFWGLDKLIPFKNYMDLLNLCNQGSI
jgi:hypothetical protein